ncbi:MAG: hypothetical protein IPM51_02795 [Sphingobacteriaceae bacterium]|nr:hypothetical protein [Sphingobacteriaceae bacterium]
MTTLRFLIIFILVLIGSQYMFGAPPPPPPPVGTPSCWPPPCIPIDGGISFLVAAGAAYGAKKLYKAHKKKSSIQ